MVAARKKSVRRRAHPAGKPPSPKRTTKLKAKPKAKANAKMAAKIKAKAKAKAPPKIKAKVKVKTKAKVKASTKRAVRGKAPRAKVAAKTKAKVKAKAPRAKVVAKTKAKVKTKAKSAAKTKAKVKAKAPRAKANAKSATKTKARAKSARGTLGATFGARAWRGEELLELLDKMLLVRRFEEKAGQLYGLGLIGGFCHLYIGQEAVVVGALAALDQKDAVTTTYRDHGHPLVLGTPPEDVMAELLGRASGMSGGRGGSMHLFDPERGFWGGHGIVGANVPLAAGIAFAKQYNDEDSISVVFFGDGALNQGQVYETFNMAALWGLPVLFLIENNKYGMGTPIERSSAHAESLHNRGRAYGIRGEKVNGMDVIAVHDAVAAARARIREQGAPEILEAMTYRYRGHSMSDPAKYRSRSEVDEVRARQDPIDGLAARLVAASVATTEEIAARDRATKERVAAAVETAKGEPEPAPETLWQGIYGDAPTAPPAPDTPATGERA